MQTSLLYSLIIYIALTLVFGFFSKKQSQRDFFANYYLGERSLGYIALSMSIFASYVSSGTFLAGLGASYKFGFAWLWIGPIQVVSVVFVFYAIGTKLRRFSVKSNSVTVPELFSSFYKSKSIGLISALVIVFFMPFMLMAQWQGGAYLVKNILALEYKTALVLFSVFVGTYTVLGGFKWVVATDILQGILMFFGAIFIYYGVVSKGMGLEVITNSLKELGQTFFESHGYNNALSSNYIISFWFLVGIGLLGLPQIILRFMAFKNRQSFNKAMILTPIMILVLMLVLNLSGIYARALLPNYQGNSDALLIELLPMIFDSFLASFIIVAVLSSIVSTADSILLIIISSINYDVLHKRFKVKKSSFFASPLFNKIVGMLVVLAIAFFTVQMQQDILRLNFLGFGAVQTAFFLPVCCMVFGLRYKEKIYSKAISANILLSILFYVYLFAFNPAFLFGFHPVVYTITTSIVLHLVLMKFLVKPKLKQEKTYLTI